MVLVVDIVGAGRADWQGKVNLVARAIGREDAYEGLVREFDAHAAEVAEEHRDVLDTERFVLAGSWKPGLIRAYGAGSNYGKVFGKAGVTLAESEQQAVAGRPEQEVEISEEQAPQVLDGSVLLYVTNLRAQPNPQLVETMSSPVFENLDVVRSGKVYPGGKDTVGGFEDANYNLRLLDDTLTEIAAGA